MSYVDGPAPATRGRRRSWRVVLPLIVFILIVGAYSAYWLWARAVLERGIDDWIAAERSRGMTVAFSEKTLGGYPYRFALILEDPAYENPGRGQRWEGERLELVMQPWNWRHVIARSPGENRIFERGLEGWARLGRQSAASVSWTDTGVTRLSIALDTVAFDLAGELAGDMEAFEFHLRPYPGEPDTIQLETHWQAIELVDIVPGTEPLGQTIGPSILRAEATRGVSAALATRDAARWPANVLRLGGELRVPQLMVNWGPLDAGARGSIRRDANGELVGQVGVRIERADALRGALTEAGLLDRETETAITALESSSADGRFLEFSVREDGLYILGNRVVPIDLGGPFG